MDLVRVYIDAYHREKCKRVRLFLLRLALKAYLKNKLPTVQLKGQLELF